MSQLPGGPNPREVRGARRAAASVTLRGSDHAHADERSMLDPAAKSLGDALRITYRLLQLTMLALVLLFLGSGFHSVASTESAIRVTLGKISSSNLGDGFQAGWPAPIGEMIRIERGAQRQELAREFFPRLSESEEKQVATSGLGVLGTLGGSDSLDPATDGQLITADGNLAHARCQVIYVRGDAAEYAHNINDAQSEEKIVRAAIRRGVVHAAACVTLDEFIKDQPDAGRTAGFRPVAERAKQAAQQALDQLKSGIVIQQFSITHRIPPRRVMTEFNRVQSAQAEATGLLEEARAAANTAMLDAAGVAAGLIVGHIDQYERQLAAGETAAAESTLRTINAILLGETVVIEGKTFDPEISGKVTQMLDGARQYASTVVSEAQAEASVFAAKRQAFAENPLVMLSADWTSAYGEFVQQPTVQTLVLPPGVGRTVITINRDPQIAKEQETARNTREFEEGQKLRDAERRRALFENKPEPTVNVAQ